MNAKFWEWAYKQGPWFVLAFVALYFYRADMRESNSSMRVIGDGIQSIERGQEKLLEYTVKGVWRAVEPPAPSELPKGVEPAKDP